MSEQQMTQHTIKALAWGRIKAVLLGLAALVFFVIFGFWSGVPTGENSLTFWIGVAVLLVVLATFGAVTWHLLFRPLPAGETVQEQPIKASYRQALAVLLGVSQYGIIIGAFWDEIWHRQYGVPFGEDFFWRPHLLMYFGIVVTIMLACAGLYIITRQSEATFRQRFRANPMIGWLALLGGFLIYALVADPIWHEIYGEDLTAWGIPHLLLWMAFNSILLLATAIYMTTQPPRAWGVLGRRGELGRHRGLPLLLGVWPLMMFAAISLSWNQFFTTEWDGIGGRFIPGRPEWLLPVLIAAGAAFIGVMANHALRVFGVATLSGLLALAMRFALIQLFEVGHMMLVNAWVLALPSLVLIDLWYAFYPRGAWIGGGVAAAVGMAGSLLTIFDRFYPLYSVTNLPVALIMLLAGSVAMSRLGSVLGDYFAEANKQVDDAVTGARLSPVSWGVAGVTATLIMLFVAFVIFFVNTATPPI